jgi:DNA-binding response OmpR family regulator
LAHTQIEPPSEAFQPRRVLVIDDEAVIRELVCLHLGLSGFHCVSAGEGRSGLERARAELFQLIVLDLVMPGMDGISVCRTLRLEPQTRATPILMLTARREEADKVLGLESGADDYLTKPFSVRELVARAGALTRRSRSTAPPAAASPRVISARGLSIDAERRRVTVDGAHVELTPLEFSLILTLASRPGIVFSREALLAQIWRGEAFVSERSVDELVKRVRHKIEQPAGGRRYIMTVWGTGYKFSDDL